MWSLVLGHALLRSLVYVVTIIHVIGIACDTCQTTLATSTIHPPLDVPIPCRYSFPNSPAAHYASAVPQMTLNLSADDQTAVLPVHTLATRDTSRVAESVCAVEAGLALPSRYSMAVA